MIGVDFVTAGEYRALLANRRDIPVFTGEIIVATAADTVEEAAEDDADRGADGTAIGGAPVDEATSWPRSPRTRRPAASKAADVR